MPNTVEIYDELNLYSWDFVRLIFDYGANGDGLTYRERIMDDETIIEEHFQDGVLMEMNQYDDPYTDVQPWEYIHTRFDYQGNVEFKMFMYDDGRRIEQNYSNGVLYSRYQFDEGTDGNPDGAYDWHFSYTEYDTYTGHARMHLIEYDNGAVQETRYWEDGTIESIEHRDSQGFNDDGGIGAHAWNISFTAFNEFGQISDRYIEFDDFGTTHDRYENGVIYSSESSDGHANSYAWDRRDAAYDENGQLAHMYYRFDDGTERTENYYEGVITDSYAYNPYNDPEYGASWHSVTMHYSDGVLFHRETDNYSGTRTVDQYEAGQLMRSDSYDDYHGPEGQAWQHQVFLFNSDDELEAKGIVWDNGDQEVTFYGPDGTSEHRYWDGDDSNDWQARTTHSDEFGVVYIEEYADEDPLPPDYIPYEIFDGGGYYI
ncbi:MAG: hypothetical protein AAF557_15270 [Pseudomonadota bacterium]